MFKDFVIFSSIICIHELGHILVALFFHWQIDKVVILPFGGMTIFKETLNKPLIQEFCIAIAGPIFQIIFYAFLRNYHPLFTLYHYSILLFNLLPIVPLDGSKIISILLYKFLSFKKTGYVILWISIFTMASIVGYGFIQKYSISLIIICLFLVLEIIRQWGKQKYLFQKFLLERYLYHYHFKSEKIIDKIEKMQREKRHILKMEGKYHTEKEILRKIFDK